MIIKRKKNTRQRGSKTHGWGAMKKHRGKGNKGGSGRAGTGKRADSKKPSYWKLEKEKGFKKKGIKKKIKVINICYLEENFDRLLKDNKIKKQEDNYVLNLEEIGYNKLLSKGKISKKIIINVPFASKKSLEKIKKIGGNVICQNPKKGK